ncbi:MAG: ribonuclease HI family protein [Candidatus Peribacteraceae bacterium]|nr:ribonuclease HI family protein [Candidatus Peribacteraceae bacterium]MDD5742801.1 ribonuclease HI family protein [Candidatus Peribacteraceae bacterium]
MTRIPAALERRLQQLFPRVKEREQFVAEIISRELDSPLTLPLEDQPRSVGGTLHLFTDGGSRGNPGQAAIGCILEDPARGVTLKEHMERIGIETNNVAEYRALIEGLKLAKHYQPNKLICHLDSELIVRQLNGQYQVRMVHLKPFVEEIQALARSFRSVTFKHIPRSDNFRADALVNRALDEHPSPKFRGIGK